MSGALLQTAETWLIGKGASALAAPARQLSLAYREGSSSSDPRIEVRAYVASRLPATLAATNRVLAELAGLAPEWRPASVLDLGAGPGTASWAAAAQWPGISCFDMIERDPQFRSLAVELAQASGIEALSKAEIHDCDVTTIGSLPAADLVIAGYALIELPEDRLARVVEQAWLAAGCTLVVIEPGTPVAFERLRRIRSQLVMLGANILAPCPGNGKCPMQAPDWCHFSRRLSRSRLHMHAKQASVPFEDEKFSYLIATRLPATPAASRVIRPVRKLKHGIELSLCQPGGLAQRLVARRQKRAYRLAAALQWGDALGSGIVSEAKDDT